MNTILITGSSSGFGLETARYFLDRDWTVIATMRAPRTDVLPASERLRVVALDVTDAASIARAVEEAGPINALVNNAGAGLMGALEGVSIDAMRQLFKLNTFGTMAMTQAVLPGFRTQGSGVIVILNATDDVTGLSNVFASGITTEAVLQGLASMAWTWRPNRRLVGYESGADLAAARRVGFETVGRLRIWRRASADG